VDAHSDLTSMERPVGELASGDSVQHG
jgi:hypothetical protein